MKNINHDPDVYKTPEERDAENRFRYFMIPKYNVYKFPKVEDLLMARENPKVVNAEEAEWEEVKPKEITE